MDNRYFFTEKFNGKIELVGQEAQHLIRVRRSTVGDDFVAFCGDGLDYFCKIDEIKKDKVVASIVKTQQNKAAKDCEIVVYLASLKNEALTSTIDYLTELNVTTCKIFDADRSVAKIEPKKLEKLTNISIQACKQCERAKVMDVEIIDKNKIKEDCKNFNNVFFAYEDAKNKIDQFRGKFAVIIGPEGGFSESEVEYFSSFATTISLGSTILRAVLAGPVAVGMLKAVQNV